MSSFFRFLTSAVLTASTVTINSYGNWDANSKKIVDLSLDYAPYQTSNINELISVNDYNDNYLFGADQYLPDGYENMWEGKYNLGFKIGFVPSIAWLKNEKALELGENDKIFRSSSMLFNPDYRFNKDFSGGVYLALPTINSRFSSTDSNDVFKYDYMMNGIFKYRRYVDFDLALGYLLKNYQLRSIPSKDSKEEIEKRGSASLHAFNLYSNLGFLNLPLGDHLSVMSNVDFNLIYGDLNYYKKDQSKDSDGSRAYYNYKGGIKFGFKYEFDTAMGILSLNPHALAVGYYSSEKLKEDTSNKLQLSTSPHSDKLFGGGLDIKLVSFNSWSTDFNVKVLNVDHSYIVNIGIVVTF